jgi:hypothetical protein
MIDFSYWFDSTIRIRILMFINIISPSFFCINMGSFAIGSNFSGLLACVINFHPALTLV